MQQPPRPTPTASLSRRLGAMLYDSLLLLGVLMLALAPPVILYEVATGEPYPHQDRAHGILLQLYLLAWIAGFYLYFWTHGGQTLGMRAWRMRLTRDDGEPPSVGDAARRFGWALLSLLPAGLGLFWCLVDRDDLTWHDRLSRTRPVVVPRDSRANPRPKEGS